MNDKPPSGLARFFKSAAVIEPNEMRAVVLEHDVPRAGQGLRPARSNAWHGFIERAGRRAQGAPWSCVPNGIVSGWRNEYSIERILMSRRQLADLGRVLAGDRQR